MSKYEEKENAILQYGLSKLIMWAKLVFVTPISLSYVPILKLLQLYLII